MTSFRDSRRVIGYDVMPTVLDFAKPGNKPPAGLEGGSWRWVLLHCGAGKVQRSIDHFVFHHAVEVKHPQSALRQGDYKLLYYWDTHERFLFAEAFAKLESGAKEPKKPGGDKRRPPAKNP